MPWYGIPIGLVPGIGYGCMAPFSTKIGGRTIQRTFGITLTCLFIGIIIFIVEMCNGLDITSSSAILYFFVALLSGIFWYLGSYFEFKAINSVGVSKAMPFSMVGQFVTVTLFSAFFFGNWLVSPARQVPLGLVCILIIVLGILLIRMTPNVTYNKFEKKSNKFPIYILLCAVGFSVYTIIPEIIQNLGDSSSWIYGGNFFINPNNKLFSHGFDEGMMFPQTLGMFIPALIMLLITNKKEHVNYFIDKKTYLNMIPGCFQAVGNLFLIISILVNTNAVASPLSEFSIVVATLLGMFYLKEKKPKPFNTITLIGLTLIFTGALLCGFSDFILKIK